MCKSRKTFSKLYSLEADCLLRIITLLYYIELEFNSNPQSTKNLYNVLPFNIK